MKTMKIKMTLMALTLSVLAMGQCPVDVQCTSNQFKFVFTTLPNSGNVDEVELKISGTGSWYNLSVDSIVGDTIFTEKSTLSCSDSLTSIKYRYNNANVGKGCNDDVALPVEFIYHTATMQGENIMIKWSTAMELNNSHFEVQKFIANTFVTIATIQGNGTTSAVSNYEYLDTYPLIYNNIYRIKQVDYDGTVDYSYLFRVYNHQQELSDREDLLSGYDIIGRKTN